jgi:tryptophanyl-tRNA synthetase
MVAPSIQVLIMDRTGLQAYRLAFQQDFGGASPVIQQADILLQGVFSMDPSTQVLIMDTHGFHEVVQGQGSRLPSPVIQQADILLQGRMVPSSTPAQIMG